MIRMTAKKAKSFTYAGKRYAAGVPFFARGESDARVLEALGLAERAPAPPTAAPPATLPPAKKVPAKRTYQRRDMTAEVHAPAPAEEAPAWPLPDTGDAATITPPPEA